LIAAPITQQAEAKYASRHDDAAHRDDKPTGLVVAPIDEVIQLAEPWQWDEPSALEGISDGEWDAFIEALKSR
jgi:hypothetical protein